MFGNPAIIDMHHMCNSNSCTVPYRTHITYTYVCTLYVHSMNGTCAININREFLVSYILYTTVYRSMHVYMRVWGPNSSPANHIISLNGSKLVETIRIVCTRTQLLPG